MMNKTDLEKILTEHTLWLHNEEGKRADLSEADLRGADLSGADLRMVNLRGADLRWANLGEADLRGADLCGADLDFSVLPLWCGSLGAKVDERIIRQIVYHTLRLAQNSEISCDLKGVLFTKELIEQANLFHRVEFEDVERITDESLAYHIRKPGAAEEPETMDGKDLVATGETQP